MTCVYIKLKNVKGFIVVENEKNNALKRQNGFKFVAKHLHRKFVWASSKFINFQMFQQPGFAFACERHRASSIYTAGLIVPILFPHQPVDLKLIVSLAFEYIRVFGKVTVHRHSICKCK